MHTTITCQTCTKAAEATQHVDECPECVGRASNDICNYYFRQRLYNTDLTTRSKLLWAVCTVTNEIANVIERNEFERLRHLVNITEDLHPVFKETHKRLSLADGFNTNPLLIAEYLRMTGKMLLENMER